MLNANNVGLNYTKESVQLLRSNQCEKLDQERLGRQQQQPEVKQYAYTRTSVRQQEPEIRTTSTALWLTLLFNRVVT